MKNAVPQKRIRVLLADDHLIVRQGIRSTFHDHPVVTIVGEAATGAEAVARTKKLSPDVVLMDINMPEMNGLEATAAIRKQFPEVKILVLTVHDTREYVTQVLRSGAQGYVLKDAGPEELARAIQAVFLGHAFFSPSIANVVLHDLRAAEHGGSRSATGGLSVREVEVLRMIVKGRTTKEIARQMNIGVRTVETYRARLMRKLQVRNAAQLTSTAIAQQLISI
jgi:DNA-binding NarL/FixJ family response regulator